MKQSLDPSGLQFAWNSGTLKLAEECPRKYQLRVIEGWERPGRSVHLIFGGIYASALEYYHKLMAQGSDNEDALVATVLRAMTLSWDSETSSPFPFDHAAKTRENLIRTIVWYLDQFGPNDNLVTFRPSGIAAVEQTFAIDVDDGQVLVGHLDRVVEYNGDLYVTDNKAQPLTSKVLTQDGWRMIKELAVGDLVATKSGKFVALKNIIPKGVTKVYRVMFNDRTSVLCGIDHLWTVNDQFMRGWETLTLQELIDKKPHIKYHVPLCEPIQHPTRELPLHPYVLGVLLGDGYLNGGSIVLSTTHEWLAQKVSDFLPAGDIMRRGHKDNNDWVISGGATLAAIKQLGLKGCLARTKFIPDLYKFSSEEQRRDLLSGLLITDGTWNNKDRLYDSMSLQLTQDVCELVRSLGGQARYRPTATQCYRVAIRMENLPTKLGRRYITEILRVSDDYTACLEVESPDGLYITENHIVTHNTTGNTITGQFFNQFSPDMQMSLYTFAGKAVFHSPVKGVVIDGAQIAVGFSRFERGFTFRSEGQLSEWYDNTMRLIHQTRGYAKQNYFPMNTSSCGNYGGCPFRYICSRTPEVRPQFLKGDFDQAPYRDPLEER